MRTGASVDFKANIDLLVGIVVVEDGTQLSAIEAVGLEDAPLLGFGFLKFGVGKRLAEIEAAGVLQLVDVGGAIDETVIADRADEPTVFGDEGDRHAAVVGLGLHLDIGIPASGEKTVDAGPDGGDFQGIADFQGENLVEFGGFERLGYRTKLDVGG